MEDKLSQNTKQLIQEKETLKIKKEEKRTLEIIKLVEL